MSATTADFRPWFGVFETLRVVDGAPLFVAEHLAEIARAARALGIARVFDFASARADVPRESGRWRWILTPTEARTLFVRETTASVEAMEISISPVRVGSANWDARFKTLSYLSHAQALEMAETPEVVLLNEHGQIASGARGNLFWRKGGRLHTPAHQAGCRCGVVRGFVRAHADVEEGIYPSSDLDEAEEIFLTNSMRGIVSVSRIQGGPSLSTDLADDLRSAYDEAVAKMTAVDPRHVEIRPGAGRD